MFAQEISISIRSKERLEEAQKIFYLLCSFYSGSGQRQGDDVIHYTSGQTLVAIFYSHEINSLDTKHNNHYVNRELKKLESICENKLVIRNKDANQSEENDTCSCKKSPFYILTTNYVSIQSPLLCGECHRYTPLYRLPVYYDYGYQPIKSWQYYYNSCDTLQMGCTVGEKWATKQMSDHDSQLSKLGREICTKIESLTSIPTYYYLHNYRLITTSKDKKRKCPDCKGEWLLEKELHDRYRFKCDRCRLLSCFSPNHP